MAAELKERFQVEAELVRLSGGVFEIYWNDELVFSKRELDRFPNDGEVIQLLEGRAA